MDNNKLKLGILLPTRGLLMSPRKAKDADTLLSMAEKADDAGLDSVWVGDSLTAKPRHEPLTTLAAVASRTRRVRLGTAVLLGALRHPVLLAQMAGTVDHISGGRTVLAIGAGGAFNKEQKSEWMAAGVDYRTRGTRLEELVEITKRLTAGETVTFSGNHFQLDSVRIEPSNIQPGGVPILLGCHWRANQERQFQRAVRLADGFISISDRPDEYAKVVNKVRDYAQQSGKNFNSMEASFYMTINLNENERRATDEAEKYLLEYYGVNIWGGRWGPFGGADGAVARMKEYFQSGANTLIIRFASFDQCGQLDTFLKHVVPAL
jgi:alkanesulfonate monooxygenase SsuD/methylene tetrahydromethanopterin reductase-like flavin-dependent oxidoreductase (luciferase family)